MQCSLCKANGKSSSFIPPSSSESVDKCVTVEAIDVDLDRNEDGDEYEETEDGVDRVDGVLGDDGDDGDEVVVVFDDFGETLPTAPALLEAALFFDDNDEGGDECGDSTLSNPVSVSYTHLTLPTKA